MALLKCNIYSKILEKGMSVTIIMPENNRKSEEIPVLYLLHGLSDDDSAWTRNTSIERYVSNKNIAVIMPGVDRSFYTDMAIGPKYFKYIVDELPRILRSFLRLSDKKEDNYICGLSMGGYGAFKIALTYPKRFNAAASLSGALDIAELVKSENDPSYKIEFENIFGDLDHNNENNDLFKLISLAEEKKIVLPKLYVWCGTEDFLYQDNLKFDEFIKNKNFDYTYSESPGDHNWEYWDKKIQEVLLWMEI